MKKKLFFGLENDEAAVVEEESTETVTVAESDAETAVAEVTEVVADIHGDLDLIEESVAEIETLEDHTEVVEDSLVDDGEGISQDHAETLNIAVESIMRRLNYPKRITISKEHFGSTHSRKQATQVTLESLSDSLLKLWEKAKEIINNVWKSVVEFFNKYFTQTGRIKQAIVDIKKKVEAAKGAPKEATIKNAGLTRAFYDFKSSSVKIDEIVANQLELTKDGLMMADKVSSVAEANVNFIKADGSLPSDDVINKSMQASIDLIGLITKGKEESGPYFNGAFFELEKGRMEAEGELKVGESGGKISLSIPALKIKTISSEVKAEGLPALTKEACGKYIKEAEALLAATEQFKAKQGKLDAYRKSNEKMNDVVIKFVKSSTDKEGAEAKKYLSELRTYAVNMNNSLTRAFVTIPSYNMNTVKALLNYVQASLRNLGEGEAAKEEEKKDAE